MFPEMIKDQDISIDGESKVTSTRFKDKFYFSSGKTFYIRLDNTVLVSYNSCPTAMLEATILRAQVN